MRIANVKLLNRKEVKSILEGDSRFFKLTQLIDYSLLIMKVDWKSNKHTQVADILKSLPNKFMMM